MCGVQVSTCICFVNCQLWMLLPFEILGFDYDSKVVMSLFQFYGVFLVAPFSCISF